MSVIAIALTIAQAAPLPVIVQNEQQRDELAAGLPCFEHGGARYCVHSIAVSGKKRDIDAIRGKLTSEGWPNSYRADRSGATILDIDTKNRTLDDAWALTNRFASREFGLLQADFVSLPVPGAK